MRVSFFCGSRIRHWINILPNWSFTWSIKHLYIFDLSSSWNWFFFSISSQGSFRLIFSGAEMTLGSRLEIIVSLLLKKVPVPFATVIQFSPQQINCQSLYGPITDSYLFWGTSLANFAPNLKKKRKKRKKRIRTWRLVQQTLFSVVTHSWTTNITNKDGFALQAFDFCQRFWHEQIFHG